uniref:Uncharacterized protein n=1 Tax=Arundo donax TaxID=35708 RepID=A0A0A9GX47_ARUDO
MRCRRPMVGQVWNGVDYMTVLAETCSFVYFATKCKT